MCEMGPILKIKELTYFYNENEDDREASKALDNISFEINRGEFVSIIGENGSGKSTLAKHFNGLLLPSSGSVIIGGMDTCEPENLWNIRQMAGMVFQNPDNQIVATTVEEDIAFGPENLGINPSEIRKRIDEAVERVDLSSWLGHAPHRLSGGQKQRLAIAGVIAMKPEILVLDEPTAMLDPKGKEEVLETIDYLNEKENITVVNITHFMDEALEADRVLVMSGGKVVMDGTPAETFLQVEHIKEFGLEVPQIIELSHLLKKEGVEFSKGVLSIDSLVDELC